MNTLYHEWWVDMKREVETDSSVGVLIMTVVGIGLLIGFPLVVVVELWKRLLRLVIE